jgi:hypothetical protein
MTWDAGLSVIAVFAAIIAVGIGFWRERRSPDEYAQMWDTLKALAGDVSRATIRILDLERQIGAHETTIRTYEDIIRRLVAQVIRMKGIPEATLPIPPTVRAAPQLLDVYELLLERFSNDELDDLAIRMGITRDELVGGTHSARAQSLIEYAERRHMVRDLVRVGREVRPDVVWPEGK